jgi:hypothetical protein
VSFSSAVNRASFRNATTSGSADHSGVRPSKTTSRILSAQPTTSSSSGGENGRISPGRWRETHLSSRSFATRFACATSLPLVALRPHPIKQPATGVEGWKTLRPSSNSSRASARSRRLFWGLGASRPRVQSVRIFDAAERRRGVRCDVGPRRPSPPRGRDRRNCSKGRWRPPERRSRGLANAFLGAKNVRDRSKTFATPAKAQHPRKSPRVSEGRSRFPTKSSAAAPPIAPRLAQCSGFSSADFPRDPKTTRPI